MKPVLKVCGVRRAADADLAVALGARFVGCVLAADSPRCATHTEVERIRDAVRGRAEVVLVFRDADPTTIGASCERTGVRRVQPVGADAASLTALYAAGLVVHRVVAVAPETTALPAFAPPAGHHAPAVLDVGRGGTGRSFDWTLLADGAPPATLIAGGIDPHNVTTLLRYEPYGIDVSSGIETAPGVKDAGALRQLCAALEATS
ncbi:MAG: phosphoribosylanthranilate isomerase [Planctomycetota bacterium]